VGDGERMKERREGNEGRVIRVRGRKCSGVDERVRVKRATQICLLIERSEAATCLCFVLVSHGLS